jgi:hypothetical protein
MDSRSSESVAKLRGLNMGILQILSASLFLKRKNKEHIKAKEQPKYDEKGRCLICGKHDLGCWQQDQKDGHATGSKNG